MNRPFAQHAQVGDALVAEEHRPLATEISGTSFGDLGEVLAPAAPSERGDCRIRRTWRSWLQRRHRVAGDTYEVLIQTRWKERDGLLNIVEASDLEQDGDGRAGRARGRRRGTPRN